jgi:hypothetical protein
MKNAGQQEGWTTSIGRKRTFALFDRYRRNTSLHGMFFRAYRMWNEAIRKNQWR